jgi:ABC-type multidrug transport system permease subunit
MKVLHAIKKEILELAHDRTMAAVLFIFPIFIMLFMGSSFGSIEIQGLPVGVVGPTNTTFSGVLFSGLSESSAFNLQDYATEQDAMEAFRNGMLRAVIIVPDDFEDALVQGKGAEVRIAVDNSDIALQEAVLAAMGSVVQASSTNITRSYVSGAWDDLQGLSSSAASLAQDIESSKTRMNATRQEISGVKQDIASLGIDRLESSLDSASSEIGRMQAALDAQNSSGFMDESSMFLQNTSFALNESIDAVEGTHSALTEQVEELEDTVTALDASIDALQTVRGLTTDPLIVTALDINIQSLTSLRNSTQGQLADARQQVQELEELNATLQNFSESLEDYSVILSTAKQEQQTALSQLSASLAGMDSSFDQAKEDVTELKGLLSDINDTADSIETTLDELFLQIEGVDSLIESLQDTVATQTGKDVETIAAPLSVKVENQYVRSSFVDFIIPHVIAVSLLFSCFLLASISLVREKSRKTVIRLLMIPGALSNAVIAKIATITLVSLGQVAVILFIAVTVFSVQVPTDFMMLAVGTAVSVLVLSSIGTLIGFYAKTESAAIQTSLLIAIPMLFLGNIIFSPDLLPTYTQLLQQLLPLAHITNIFKVVLITGGDPAADMAALLSYFVLLALLLAFIVLKRRDITHYV